MSENRIYLSFQDVSKTYKETVALDRISFELFEGETFGYIGPNGAGKTTTIKILVGLNKQFRGLYKTGNNSSADIYEDLGYLPQGVTFQNWRTVENVLETFGKISGLDNSFLKNRIDLVTGMLELEDVRNRNISKLSGGMIQKLGLAQALLNNPGFLVLDEPLSGLDPASRYEFKKIIKNLSGQGTTVFFSSHILSDVQIIADRVAILNKGRILKIGDTEELTNDLYENHIFEITFFDNFDNSALLHTFNDIVRVERKSSKRLFLHVNKSSDVKAFSREVIKKLLEQNTNIQSFGRITPDLDEVYLKYVTSG